MWTKKGTNYSVVLGQNKSIIQSINQWIPDWHPNACHPRFGIWTLKKYTPKHQDIRRYDWMSDIQIHQIKSNQSTNTLILNLNQTNWYFNLHGSFWMFEPLHIGFPCFFSKKDPADPSKHNHVQSHLGFATVLCLEKVPNKNVSFKRLFVKNCDLRW